MHLNGYRISVETHGQDVSGFWLGGCSSIINVYYLEQEPALLLHWSHLSWNLFFRTGYEAAQELQEAPEVSSFIKQHEVHLSSALQLYWCRCIDVIIAHPLPLLYLSAVARSTLLRPPPYLSAPYLPN